jgi:type I restriction enzyme S subunit
VGDDALPEIFSMSAPALVTQFERLAGAPGGVERLRELILTLAVRGKLVSQEPSDEPASALLQGIRAEKERRIADGRIKPDKASSEAIDQHPFEIPETWIWVSMGEVVEIVRGITFPASEKTKESGPGRIACLRTANVQESIEWDDLLFVSRSFMGREDQLLKLHDIVMSMANSRELVGKVALVDQIPHAESTFGGFLGVLRPWRIDPRYAMAVLRSSYARSTLIDSSSQTTNIANISLGKLRPLPFPLPPLAEQARIVARVDELMQLCDALEAKGRLEAQQHARLLETLLGTLTESTTPEELAANWQRVAEHFDLLLDRPEAVDGLEQTVLQLAVRGLLVQQDPRDEPVSALIERVRAEKERLIAQGKVKRDKPLPPISDEEKPFELPEGWEWVRLSDLTQKIGAGSTPLGGREVYVPTGVKFLRSQNVWNEGLRLDGVAHIKAETHARMKGTVVISNDLLFNITGASIGRCAVVPSDFDEANVSQHVTIVRTVFPELNAFLHKVLVSRHVQQAVMDVQVGVSREGLSIAKLALFLIPLPPLEEQSRIVARVTEIRRLCAGLRQRLAASQATQSRLAEALVEAATA